MNLGTKKNTQTQQKLIKAIVILISLIAFKWDGIGQEIRVHVIINDSLENEQQSIQQKFNTQSQAKDFFSNQLNQFLKQGYLNTWIDSTINQPTHSKHYLSLNKKIDSINIKIPKQYQEYLKTNNNETLIAFEKWGEFQNIFLQQLSEEGYNFSKITYAPLSVNENILNAELQLEINKQRKINDLVIRGYEEFPEGFRRHFLNIKRGELYTERKLRRKTKALQNIDFVNEIKNPEVQFTKDSVNLFLYLEKNKINSFDGFIGFGNSEEGSGLNLNGYLDVLLKNNLNYGETLIIRYKNDGQEQQIFKSRISIPFIFNSRFSPEAGIELFRQDSTFSRNKQEIRLGYHINHQWETFADLELVSSSNLSSDDANTTNQPITDFNARFYGITTRFNNRKRNIGEIINRDYAELRLLRGNRSTSAASQAQTKIEFYGETLQKLVSKTYAHLASTIHVLQSGNYVDNELERLGGLRSIRGFDENSLIASSFYSLQTEIRYFLSPDLYANTVLDYGYYENKLINFDENLFSFGFGIGLNTKGGLLRLIFANGRSSQQEFNFQNTQVHLSLNTFF